MERKFENYRCGISRADIPVNFEILIAAGRSTHFARLPFDTINNIMCFVVFLLNGRAGADLVKKDFPSACCLSKTNAPTTKLF